MKDESPSGKLKEIGFSTEIRNFPSYEGGFGGNLIVAKAP